MEKDFRSDRPQTTKEKRAEWEGQLDPAQREKMKKNLVYVAIFSIIMFFMAFTSAYIVSSGDSYWVKYDMPPAFWISTLLIGLSSLTLILAIKNAQKDQFTQLKAMMVSTYVLGIGFAIFQFVGYGQLIERGAHAISKIIVTEGRYSDYYELKYKGTFLGVDGNNYTLNGKVLSPAQQQELVDFAQSVNKISNLQPVSPRGLGKNLELIYKNKAVTAKNGKLYVSDTSELKYVDLMRLQDLAVHMQDRRIDFFLDGTCGKDFQLMFKGKSLDYKNRELFYQGKKLDYAMQIKLNQTSDQATSYLFLITILHLLHVLAGLMYLTKMLIWTFRGKFNASNTLSLRLGGIFWHFLGILWVYLLLFLLFIH
jgi:cytochrome c oxidase subunit III